MKFQIDEPGGSIYSDVDIVFLSIYDGSISDIYMEKPRFIFFEFSTDSFSSLFSLPNESPRLEMVICSTPRKDAFSLLEHLKDISYFHSFRLVEIVK